MATFKQYIAEKYINVFSPAEKQPYVDQVWDILQKSYKPIGGMKGIGSKEDMINSVEMWKVAKQGDIVFAVILYKDKGVGRKVVAVGTNGTPEAKIMLRDMFKHEFVRSFGEYSGPLLVFMKREFPDLVKQYTVPVDQVEKILGKPITPTKNGMYRREIRGVPLEKIMIGTSGKTIKR